MTHTKLMRILIFSYAIVSTQVFAAEKLGLEQAIEKAKNYSKNLQIQNNELSRYHHMYRQALGSALPQVSLSSQYLKYPHKPQANGVAVKLDYEVDTGIQVTQALYTFGAVSNALDAADAGLEMGKLGIDAAEKDVVFQVKQAYFSVALATEQLKVSKEYLEGANRNLKVLKKYFQSGRPSQGDLIRLEADIASRTIQLRESEYGLKKAMDSLKQIVGYPLDKEIQINTQINNNSFKEEDLNKLISKMLENEPGLKVLKKNVDLQTSLAGVEKSSSMPKIAAFFTYNRTGMDTDAGIESDKQYDYSTVGVAVSWNIWDGGSSRAKYQQSLVDVKNAEIRKKDAEDQYLLSLNNAFFQYESSRRSYDLNKKAIELAEKSYKISQNRFDAGKTSVTELNDVEGLLVQGKLNKALTEFKLNQSLALIEKLTSPVGRLK